MAKNRNNKKTVKTKAIPQKKIPFEFLDNLFKGKIAFYFGLIIIISIYLVLYQLLGHSLFTKSDWNTYTLQADAWWHGKYWLKENYSYLELALFKGKVFVSFPPVPSVVVFLFMPFFGMNVPDNLLTSFYMVLSFVFAYQFCRNLGKNDLVSSFWALFLVAGNNIFAHSVNGGVWFQAQSLSFLLSTLALYFISTKKKLYWHLSFLAWALSIGCRPLQVVFVPVLLYVLYQNIKSETIQNTVFQNLFSMVKFAISPLIVAMVLGYYNYIRFGNPVEFGHTYLKEFLEAPKGQFNSAYLFENWNNIFRLPKVKEGHIIFERFNGWAFYLANPIYILFFICLIKNSIRKISLFDVLIFGSIALHIVFTLMHKTIGGWQFGVRYLADGLPFLLFYMMYRMEAPKKQQLTTIDLTETAFSIILAFGAIVLNFYGCLWLFKNWN